MNDYSASVAFPSTLHFASMNMNASGWIQVVLFLVVLTALSRPLGRWMAAVYDGSAPPRFLGWLRPLETVVYRVCGIDPSRETSWREYTIALLAFHLFGLAFVFGVQILQGMLPLNPEKLPGTSVDLAFNTAVSFTTNTNWQSYGGETTMSQLTQMLALGSQNFLSAAVGMAVLAAFIRGFTRKLTDQIGNFWADLVRGVVYILLPLSVAFALVLVSQGVVQSFSSHRTVALLEPIVGADGTPVKEQQIPLGPAASQIAIKQLGTNGGGYFNVNSAHPLENPTPLSNFLEMLAILLIPAALCHTFGKMAGDSRQGWAVYAAMAAIFVAVLSGALWAEHQTTPLLTAHGADSSSHGPGADSHSAASKDALAIHPEGNMEGKEVRFGTANSVLWAVSTTAASNGSVNAMHDSFTPLGGMAAMWMMQLGEVVFGGVGSGLYGMLVFAILAVFVSGLMIGRTPEYLGKKIEAFEMQMAALAILIPCLTVLVCTAAAVLLPAGLSSRANPGPHGFSEILYAYSSAANNNGSAFAGLNANTPFYNYTLAAAMLLGRFGVMLPVLAAAGSLARKKHIPTTAGTLPTHGPLFVVLLVSVVLVVGALTFLPALALGPIVEHLSAAG